MRPAGSANPSIELVPLRTAWFGRKIAILAGQGALNARAELEEIAERLGTPVVKALLGKADDSPHTTGGIGHLDTVLILGSTMLWIDSYPRPDLSGAILGSNKP